MPLLFFHPPPLLLICSALAPFPRSRSVSKSPFVSCPLNPPSPRFLPLCPNLALWPLCPIYLPLSLVQHHLQHHRVQSLKQKKVIEIPLCLASLMFLQCYFCTVPAPSPCTLCLSLSLSDTLSVSFSPVLHEACKAGTQMRFLDHNLFILSE